MFIGGRISDLTSAAHPDSSERAQITLSPILVARLIKTPSLITLIYLPQDLPFITMEVIVAGASWVLNKAPSPQKVLGNIGLVSLAAWSDLSDKLSPNASITLPHDVEFGGLISRWRDWHAPQAGAVVAAFTEADVQETVSGQENKGMTSD